MSDILDTVPARMVADLDATMRKHLREQLEDEKAHPLGSLGLPPLLDQRRLEYHIPRCYFDCGQYVGDHILIYQIPVDEKTESGLLYKPDQQVWAETRGTTHGIICNAGLTALDHLRSHGIDLGHRVIFLRQAPFHPLLGSYESTGIEIRGIDAIASDVRCSVDLREAILAGKAVLKTRVCTWQGQKFPEHYYENPETGEDWSPVKIDMTYMEE